MYILAGNVEWVRVSVLSLVQSKSFTAGKREFQVQLLRFANGCFLSMSEGERMKIGAMTLALKTGEKVDSSTILPGRYEGIAVTLLAQAVANATGGIAIVSLYTASELDREVVKTMISEVKALLQ